MNEILKEIIDKNPGLVSLFLTGLILPLGVIWLNNRNNKRMKEIDKELNIKYNSKEDLRLQEKMVYASLSRILFDVQQLYVSLSGNCVDNNCISDAVKKFDSSITKNHEEISNNMLYLSSKVINLIYGFYNEISELKIGLKELNDRKEYEMAHVSVYVYSQALADKLIDIQELFIKERTDLKIDFDKTQQEMMKYCCGLEPPMELQEKYEKIQETLFSKTAS